MITVNINKEKNGIEVRFGDKPNSSILTGLKANGFRWSPKQKIWYAKQTPERIEFANSITDEVVAVEDNMPVNESAYSLWSATRPEKWEHENISAMSTKDITAAIRKHIKARFPMCKFSVRCIDYDEVSIDLLQSPFEKGSDELNAIVAYVYAYEQSFNYCTNYDPFGDYGSSYNFHPTYENSIVSYNYVQTEMTGDYVAMGKEFHEKKAEFDAAEEIRKQEEYEAYVAAQKLREEEARAYEEMHKKELQYVVDNVKVIDTVDYFILNTRFATVNKNGSLVDYKKKCDMEERTPGEKCNNWNHRHCRITKNIVFTDKEAFEIFTRSLLDDFDFISNTGGDATQDIRVNAFADWNMMDKKEQETVEWYGDNCVAVYFNDALVFVVDAQGYSYCRYVGMIYPETEIGDYECKQALSEEEVDKYKQQAEALEDVSTEIIINSGLQNTWNNDDWTVYSQAMKKKISDDKCTLSARAIQQIDGDMIELKNAMYKLLVEWNSVQEQFERAGFKDGDKITLVKISGMGMFSVQHYIFKSAEKATYAQYTDVVKLIVRPERKRNDYYMYLYGDMLVYKGWIDVPETLLYDVSYGEGYVTKHSKFLSCDTVQYDAALDYFKEIGYYPVVNSYNYFFDDKD